LLTLTEGLLGRAAAFVIGFFFLFVLFATACLWTRQFAENTLLTALPSADFYLVVVLYVFSAMLLVYLGIEAMARATYILMPFGIAGLLLVFAGLASQIRPLYIFPLLGNGLTALFKPSLLQFGASGPLAVLLLLAPSFQNSKTLQAALVFGFGGSILLRSVANLVYVMVFGVAVATEKTLPFYEMARLIYINRYVQRLEALFILLWVIMGVLGIAACLFGSLYIIVRLFKLPAQRPLLLPMGLIMASIAAQPPDVGVVLSLSTMLFLNISAPGIATVTVVLLVAALLKGRKKICDMP
jgi:spore germination protein KB